MSSQFIHFEEYSLTRKGDKPDAIGVLKEARREASHARHVIAAYKVRRIYGLTLQRVEVELLHASQKLFNGRKLRKDARVLLAGVASYPIAFTDNEFCEDDFKRWIKSTAIFLKKKFGNNLKAIVSHEDEPPYGHIHFYCYDTSKMSVKAFHPGNIEEAKCVSNSGKANAYSDVLDR